MHTTVPSRLAALALLAMAACSGGSDIARPDLPKTTTPGEAFEGTQCTAVRPPTEPDLMGWDPGSRANLNLLRGHGVVAVRYRAEGCNVELEVLSNCIGKGEYGYSPYSASDTKIARNSRELYAELPIGAAKLGGKLKGGRALRTDYTLVGVDALPPGSAYEASDLKGPECERATHVVSKVYLGGFAMVAGDTQEIEAGANVFGVGAGASQASKAERLAREGLAEACEKAQVEGKENAQCSVPLRVGLLAISGRAEAPPAPPAPPAPKVAPASTTGSADMVQIPGGTFSAGFWIDRTEVTTAAYAACVRAGKCTAPSTQGVGDSEFCNWGNEARTNHPINCVSWNQATAYCAAVDKRLPTEHEWELAALGTDGRQFPWGNSAPGDQACWNRLARRLGTCAVGSFPAGASPYGALDMAGNVWEWTSSNFDASTRVDRGGGWHDSGPAYLRAAHRHGLPPADYGHSLGFRCAR